MKAITLIQPYATLVAVGAKKIETRTWATKYRGPLAIHAGIGPVGREEFDLALTLATNYHMQKALSEAGHKTIFALPRSAVLATCRLVDCVRITADNVPPYPERAFGDFSRGRFMWVLEDIERLPEPAPAKGLQRLWEWKRD